jgi:4-amino-4-deoxy-L-arabinose transferase-like glycosyltransferase
VNKFIKENRLYIFGGVVALVLFSLRFYHLTLLPVFADEAIYIRWAQIMKAEETLRFLPLSDGKQPLFMWIVIPFLKFISDPLMSGRVVSVFSGLGTMLGVTYLSWLLFKSKNVSLVAAFIYSVMPFAFFFNRLALADSLLTMFGIWTFILSYLSITKSRLDFAMLAGFALGGAWLTKSPALFFALMLPTLLIFADWKKDVKSNVFVFLRTMYYVLCTVLIGYGFYNILRLGPNYSMIASRNADYVWPISHFLFTPFDPLKPWLLQSWQWIVMMGPWPILVLLILGYFLNFKKNWKALLVLTIWFLGPIFIESEFAKVLTARYILFTIPYLVIIASSAFLEQRNILIKILTVILALLIAHSLVFDYHLLTSPEKANLPRSERSGYLEEWTAGQGIKETADYLINEQITHPDEKIIVGTEGHFGTLPDGLMAYLNNEKQITVIGVGLNFTNIPKPLIESRNFGNKTYLLINNDRFQGDAEKEGLKLIAEYPKALKPDGTRESLLFFELSQKTP